MTFKMEKIQIIDKREATLTEKTRTMVQSQAHAYLQDLQGKPNACDSAKALDAALQELAKASLSLRSGTWNRIAQQMLLSWAASG